MNLSNLKNNELLTQFSLVIFKERTATAEVVSYIAELYKRRLYAELGYSSLFVMLTEKYLYSKSAAYRRIQAAKVFLLFPRVLEYLNQGRTNLINLSLIESQITKENGERVINDILDKNKEEVEYYIANSFSGSKGERTQDKIRRLPVIKKESENSHSGNLDIEENREKKPERSLEISLAFSLPVTGTQERKEATKEDSKIEEIRRVKIEFTADEELVRKIERAQQLLRHKHPQGKFEDIFDEALELLLEKKDLLYRHPEPEASSGRGRRIQSKLDSSVASLPQNDNFRTTSKKVESRYIPQELRREIWKRDKGKCTFQSRDGRQCHEQGMLEVDHIEPWGLGGKHEVENLRLIYASHNKWRAENTFGIRRSLI